MSARRGLLALVTVLALGAGAVPAAAEPVLAAGDASELAASMATATKAQGVCYGWSVAVVDGSGGPSGLDVGSDKGVGVPVDKACEKWVEFEGAIEYTCESCEGEDAAGGNVASNLPTPPQTSDLIELGFDPADLVKDTSDVLLSNMVGALPLLVASSGSAAPVPPPTVDVPEPAPGDVATGTPSTPDWLREHWLLLSTCLLLALGGGVWLLSILRGDRRRKRASGAPDPFPPVRATTQ